jgi:hypothetical protein
VKNLIKSGEEAYVLVDETQANHEAALFVDLLKNMEAHNVTTIAAGITSISSLNGTMQFTQRYNTDALFLKTNHDLDNEGVVGYFAPEDLNDEIKAQIRLLLNDIHNPDF